jgi:sporulation protein YlmC with PRC-barrel domain
MTVNTLSAGTLKGTDVVNPRGENLGKLEEIMLDLDSNRVSYAVLSFGGFMGLGDKLFAIPWQAFTVNTDEEQLILNIDKETLKNAEGFDKNNWPDFSSPEWHERTYQQYGYEYDFEPMR